MKKSRGLFGLIIALAMALSLCSAGAVAEQGGSGGVLLPDLSNLEQVKLPEGMGPSSGGALAGGDTLTELDYSGLSSIPVSGVDLPEIPEGAVSMYNAISPFSLPKTVTVGSSQQFYDLLKSNGTKIDAVVAAIGEHCRVYIDTNVSTYNNFKPTGTSAHTAAQELADEFDDIYELITGVFGAPDLTCFSGVDPSGKINLLLYDISGDEDSSNETYIAGFFYSIDFYKRGTPGVSYSNEDAILYVDIDANHGYANYIVNKLNLFGTVAHELQHLINFSKHLANDKKGITGVYAGEPEGTNADVSVWFNEGLSGLAEAIYFASMGQRTYAHLNYLLSNNFYSNATANNGYVPTSSEWSASNSSTEVLAQYGASNYLLQEFYAYRENAISSLVEYPVVGYRGSQEAVGTLFWDEQEAPLDLFDDYFTLAMLNLAADTPDSSSDAIENDGYKPFLTTVFDNAWTHRANRGVNTLGANQTVSMQSRRYFTQLYLADSVGAENNVARIKISNNPKLDYYVISPFNATGINTRNDWNTAAKIVGKLSPGENIVQVGTDNMFAVIAISLDEKVSSEAFSYTAEAREIWLKVLGSSTVGTKLRLSLDLGAAESAGTQNSETYIVAAYGGNGKMLAVATGEVNWSNGAFAETKALEIPLSESDSYSLKLILFDESSAPQAAFSVA